MTYFDIYEESKRLKVHLVLMPCPGGETVEEVQERAEEFFEVIAYN